MPDTQPDLQPISDRLREERPTLTALEQDTIKRRVMGRARKPQGGSLLRARLAIVSALVVGLLMTMGGTGLAISGFTDQSPAQNQYGTPAPVTEVLGETETGTTPGDTAPEDTPPEDTAVPEDTGSAPEVAPQERELQPARQVEVSGDEGTLPFTGFAALPILLGGVALLSAGVLMHRRASRSS